MRKVTKLIGNAFNNHKKLTVGNTTTDGESIWLHGNKIVRREDGGSISVNTQGWNTPTTKERLSFFCNARTVKGVLYINDEIYEGGWVEII